MSNEKILVVLQNAYDRGSLSAGFNPKRWLNEFEHSRTGHRLLYGALESRFTFRWDLRYTNASPKLGHGSSSKHQPDRRHLRRRLRDVAPDLVLACGQLAEAATSELWSGPLVAIPHPASRVLTNELLKYCSHCLGWWSLLRDGPNMTGVPSAFEIMRAKTPRIALRQRRGSVETIQIERSP